ncbi:MAG: ribonuclease HI family protein [Armatimonadota bacterium]|nr:ribonuclease HI family protein [Armatimonadota bacterium]MDR7401365.1 ribonuclease HI family protein [Armatimonadota bacterium]MDR7404593.1 ribonuclease HI family protein [Armatimonadota bacterium]MDR7438226.1 ribonuclease HI family protein [Armatimonadota bacterium]MDR7506103.1 ribonuclease HI family protein [Armatimonadota bacterium]
MSPPAKHLVLMVDGASRGNPGPAAIGVVVADARGRVVREIGEFIGQATNNVAEYRALLRALEEARALGAESVDVRSDSELLVSQLRGTYRVKSPDLGPLYLEAVRLLRSFTRYTVTKVPRGQNAAADALANQALDAAKPEAEVEYAVLVRGEGHRYTARVPALEVEGSGRTRSEALEAARREAARRLRELLAQGRPIPREERIRIRLDEDHDPDRKN